MKKFALALAPLALGLFAAIALQSGIAPNDVLYLRADLGSFVLTASLLASGVAALVLAVWQWSLRDIADEIAHARAKCKCTDNSFGGWITRSKIRSRRFAPRSRT